MDRKHEHKLQNHEKMYVKYLNNVYKEAQTLVLYFLQDITNMNGLIKKSPIEGKAGQLYDGGHLT